MVRAGGTFETNERNMQVLRSSDSQVAKAVDVGATSSNPLPVSEATLTIRVDEVDSSNTYLGTASVGSATSSASWQIKKIIESGTLTSILFADGDTSYDNVWDDRASLSYS